MRNKCIAIYDFMFPAIPTACPQHAYIYGIPGSMRIRHAYDMPIRHAHDMPTTCLRHAYDMPIG